MNAASRSTPDSLPSGSDPSSVVPLESRSQLERLASLLQWGQSGRGQAAGRDRGGRLGRAGEFEEYRPWRPGDDLRSLDVRVYHRLRKRVTRIDREDSSLPLTLLIDRSASMAEPARDRCVRELALFFLALARYRGEARRVLFFSEDVPFPVSEVDPATIDRAFDRVPPSGSADFGRAVPALPLDPRGPGRLILLSDAFGLPDVTPLTRSSAHGRVLLLAPWTRQELTPSPVGAVTLRSRENEPPWSGVIDKTMVNAYVAQNDRRWAGLTSWFRERGGDAHRVIAEAGALGAIESCLERGRWLRR